VIFHKFAVSKINYLRIVAVKEFEVLLTACDMVRQIIEGEGYGCPEICSPEELLEVDK
jgi:hypothetical protein